MKRLPAVLLCIMLALAPIACSQDKGKPTTRAQSKSTQAQKKAPAKSQKAPTVAQRKQQDRMGDCNKQANLKNLKGEERRRFVSSCLGGRA